LRKKLNEFEKLWRNLGTLCSIHLELLAEENVMKSDTRRGRILQGLQQCKTGEGNKKAPRAWCFMKEAVVALPMFPAPTAMQSLAQKPRGTESMTTYEEPAGVPLHTFMKRRG
jgi:hypothetical protein